MLVQIVFAFGSAALSSALTLGVAWWLFRRRWLPRLEDELRAREAALDAKLAAFGQRLEVHVKKGIVDGVTAIPSSEVLRESTRSLARTGAEAVSAGLERLLGGRPRRP
ncbi:MAG TPA: hypothetical protein VGG06_15945 [Thermoanaerobaculia bacterium]|jgi:hypothetical protein